MPLYCYRPLTSAFIRSHLGLLVALPTYAPIARVLEGSPGTAAYLRPAARGEPRRARERADMALRCFLARVFEERSEFGFDGERFRRSYDELERSLLRGALGDRGRRAAFGVALEAGSAELALGDGLAIVRPGSLAEPPPDLDAGSGAGGAESAAVLLVLRITSDRHAPPPLAAARARSGAR